MTTLKIDILGTGCKKCQLLEAHVKEAVDTLNLTADITHVTDPVEIAMRGVMSTPSLVINGQVVSVGKVLNPAQIQPLLQA